jgi:hypothetical protein
VYGESRNAPPAPMKEKKRRTVVEASPAAAMVAGGEGGALTGLSFPGLVSRLHFGLCVQDTQPWATICCGLSK